MYQTNNGRIKSSSAHSHVQTNKLHARFISIVDTVSGTASTFDGDTQSYIPGLVDTPPDNPSIGQVYGDDGTNTVTNTPGLMTWNGQQWVAFGNGLVENVVTLAGTAYVDIPALATNNVTYGTFTVSVRSRSEGGPVGVFQVSRAAESVAAVVIETSMAPGLTTSETLDLKWDPLDAVMKLRKDGSGHDGDYVVSVRT